SSSAQPCTSPTKIRCIAERKAARVRLARPPGAARVPSRPVSPPAASPALPPPAAGSAERLALSVLLGYSAAQFGLSASNTLIALHLPYFYIDTLLLPPALFGV